MTLTEEHAHASDCAHEKTGGAEQNGDEKEGDASAVEDARKQARVTRHLREDIEDVVEDGEHDEGQARGVEENPKLLRGSPGVREREKESDGGKKSEGQAGR